MNNNIDNLNNVSLIGSVHGSRKHQENFAQNLTKNQAIVALKKCNYRTPSKKIGLYLEKILGIWEKVPDRWLQVGLFYTPKTINSVIGEMVRRYENSGVPLNNPGGYFNSIIKHKQKRKQFRRTNSTRKQQFP
jgi:hypothetical protein